MADRQLLCTKTNEPMQPVRITFSVRDGAAVLALFRRLKCVQPDPARRRLVWLYEDEARKLSLKLEHRDLPKEVRPLVLGSIRTPSEQELVVHVLSFDRAVEALRFFAPRMGRAAVPVRARVLNRLIDASENLRLDEVDGLLDHDVVVLDPKKKVEELKAAVMGAGALSNPARAVDALWAHLRRDDIPEVEEFPIDAEEEGAGYTLFAGALNLRFVRAWRRWQGQTDVTLADIVEEAVLPKEVRPRHE